MRKPNINPNASSSVSQNRMILAHMMRGNGITNDSARRRPFLCQNLQGRIWDIRHKMNVDVKDRWKVGPSGKRYKEYYIECESVL